VSDSIDYKSSGVDIAKSDAAVASIGDMIRRTYTPNVMSSVRQFAGGYRIPGTNRMLLASIDGVGTKLKLAVRARRYRGVGHDLVNHCVNDVLVHGGRPLFFLDYIGTATLGPEWFREVVSGLAEACESVGCALIGGETAEMPGVYHGDDFDLVGSIVAEVELDAYVDGSRIAAGDVVVGLESDGLHTNGYSLARRVLAERANDDLDAAVPGSDISWADALLQPHRCYRNPVAEVLEHHPVRGMAHITGGGLPGNLSRVLPDGVHAAIDGASWTVPPVFEAIGSLGGVPRDDLYSAFNMGIGYVIIAAPSDSTAIIDRLAGAGERPHIIGEIIPDGSGRAGGVRIS
jgi:phosphoribosylformylglycinamidine cyclo-ligase